MNKVISLFILLFLLMSCGHTVSRKVGLMSLGDLEGKKIPENSKGVLVRGKSCGYSSYLSEALRDALDGTEFDTVLDAVVTSETGFLVANNCLVVSGQAHDSKKWKKR